MRFTFAESMCDPSHYVPLVKAAEEAGYTSFTVPDSICYPQHSDTRYPYTPDGSREFLRGRPFIEPFSLVPYLAAHTERLRYVTFVLKLPIRNPVLVAKSASSVAVLTGNRFGLGVGLSPWPEDFVVTGQDWRTRGPRTDEMIEIIRGLCAGGFFSYRGRHYEIPPIEISPVPDRPIPILVGGHSEPALRRAARLGDGWMHAGGDPAELSRCLHRLKQLREEYGRASDPFEIHVISLDGFTVDGVRRLEEQGVTDVIVGFRNAYEPDTMTVEQKVDALRRFADAVIAKV